MYVVLSYSVNGLYDLLIETCLIITNVFFVFCITRYNITSFIRTTLHITSFQIINCMCIKRYMHADINWLNPVQMANVTTWESHEP